ncbi:MAG: 23S rRNA (uracil(1939)-C(5))-methyltransferase RlmD [Kaiparowitsia implicata GSE-PSE-MK54-09C]|jgi:23S rRNA (uracil1939-C5)-methyltransferase|nr:23S rRNA (uracil(1939)-C(5))-methyltransferase RlmD [Kaiparowitsia implicata GSE-PSE-MK54-09C]
MAKGDEQPAQWQQGAVMELAIASFNHNGDGVGRWQDRVVFVPGAVVGDRLRVRLMRVKPSYAHARLLDIVQPSPHRIRPRCIVADKCGGCQWQQVSYQTQLNAKNEQLQQDLVRIGGWNVPPVDPMLGAVNPLGYRNKATYPLGRSPQGQVQAGYFQQGSHHLINLNQCPIQDERLNPLLADIKQDIQQRGWSIYNEQRHRGKLRHLGLRIGRRTGELLITLVSTSEGLPELEDQVAEWMSRYPNLVGVVLNLNPARTNAIFGDESRAIAGRDYLEELFAGLTFRIHSTTFFQVNTEQAEALLGVMQEALRLTPDQILLDAYSGIGTLTLPLARQVKRAIALEVQPQATAQAQINAEINGIHNVDFHTGAVETLLPALAQQSDFEPPDVVLLDPPRKGCDPAVLEALLQLNPARIAYMSCNSSTLARDLKLLCAAGTYRLVRVQPADFFPQTTHVESVALLSRVEGEQDGA